MRPQHTHTEAKIFADLATVVIVHTDHVAVERAIERARAALTSRTAIEQAKGVVSHQHGLDMASAYLHLKKIAFAEILGLTAVAAAVIRKAQQR